MEEELVKALEGMVSGYLQEADPYSLGGFRRNLEEDECVEEALKVIKKYKEQTDART